MGENVTDIVISAEGSWKVVREHNGSKDQLYREPDCNMESVRSASQGTEAVDLTLGEDGKTDSACQPGSQPLSQRKNDPIETEDRKPFKDSCDFPAHQYVAETPPVNHTFLTLPLSLQPENARWPGTWSPLTHASLDAFLGGSSDSILPVLNPEPLASVEASQPNFPFEQITQVRPLAEDMPLQSSFENAMINHESERLPIPRHVNRTPIAVQALPVQAQPPNSFKRMRINGPNSSFLDTTDSSSAAYQTVNPVTMGPNGHTATSGSRDMQHVMGTSALSMSQVLLNLF